RFRRKGVRCDGAPAGEIEKRFPEGFRINGKELLVVFNGGLCRAHRFLRYRPRGRKVKPRQQFSESFGERFVPLEENPAVGRFTLGQGRTLELPELSGYCFVIHVER